ncbi:helix-turn-helix domain-containing protein [candidate division KSB1 bacterium]|nr:helix-turn-helix domain-containing protein [candidate division KSB1 bacterium]
MERFNKRLLDVKTAAEYLSISRAKLYQWVDAGKIPSVRIDGRRLFDILELNEFVERLKRDRRN